MSTATTESVQPDTPPPLAPPARPFAAALEAVELELSLGMKGSDEEQFDSVIREAAEAVGGVLLFHVKVGEADDARWMAAVAFGEPGPREIAVIDLPANGGPANVSPAAQSDLPIAAIASAYAGLAECWGNAS